MKIIKPKEGISLSSFISQLDAMVERGEINIYDCIGSAAAYSKKLKSKKSHERSNNF